MQFLIVKTSSLGDILQAFPVASYLYEKFPGCAIDWVVEKPFCEIVQANPQIRQVLIVETKKWRKSFFSTQTYREIGSFIELLKKQQYDAVIDLQGNIKSGLITWQAKSHVKIGFAKQSVPESVNLLFTHKRYNPLSGQNIRQNYLSIVQQHFQDPKIPSGKAKECILSEQNRDQAEAILAHPAGQQTRKIMVCPGSAWKNKQVSPVVLKDFLQRLNQMHPSSFFILWGNEQEKAIAESLQQAFPATSVLVGRLPLPALQKVMSHMELVISMDSLPLHLAGVACVPTFSFFGPSSSAKYKPDGPEHFSLAGNCPYGRTFEKRCPILRTCETGACIHSITAEDAFKHYMCWWQSLSINTNLS